MRLRSAVFLDLDNVHSSLRTVAPAAAGRFVNAPSRWLEGLADGSLLPFPHEDCRERAVLIARCYSNPTVLNALGCRANFSRAGFSVVDCPSLTKAGKSSADIRMVIDVFDALERQPHLDEFVIMSADADFTPVLERLRAEDKRTAVFANESTAAAYKAVADGMVDLFDLVEVGAPASGPWSLDEALAGRMIDAVERSVSQRGGAAPLAAAAAAARDAVGGEVAGWAGHGSFRRLLEARLPPTLGFSVAENRVFAAPASGAGAGGAPKSMPAAAKAAPAASAGVETLPEPLRETAAKVREITTCPNLSAEAFEALFASLSRLLETRPFDLNEFTKLVRDDLADLPCAVGRGAINYVVRGVMTTGFDFGGDASPQALARAYLERIRLECANAGAELDAVERSRLAEWLGAGSAPVEAGP